MTIEEGLAVILNFAIWHNLSDLGLQDLLEMLNVLHPKLRMPSLYKFFKRFPVNNFVKYFYCPTCRIRANFQNGVKSCKFAVCDDSLKVDNLKKNGKYFLYIPLKEQLEKLFSSDLFYKLKRDDPTVSDITSWEYYK